MYSNSDEISINLKDLFLSITGRIKVILTSFAVCLLIATVFALITPDKYEIEGTIIIKPETLTSSKINNVYSSSFYNEFTKKNSLMDAAEPLPQKNYSEKFDYICENLDIIHDSTKNEITFHVKSTSNPDYFISLITNLINNASVQIMNDTLQSIDYALIELSNIEKNITEKLNNTTNAASILNMDIFSITEEINIANQYKNKITTDGFSFYEFSGNLHTEKITPAFTSIVFWIIVCFIGVFIGIIIAFVQALTDDHIYKIHDIMETIDNNSVSACEGLPYFESNNSIDARNLSLFALKIDNNVKKIIVTSINDKAGKTTVIKCLNSILNTNSNNIEFIEKPSLLKDLNINLNEAESKDTAIILVLNAGIDTKTNLGLILEYLNNLNKNVYLILNFAQANDSRIIKIPECKYRKKPLFSSISKYYRH